MIFFPILVLVGLSAWFLHKIGGGDFLSQFAKLVDRPQIAEGFTSYLTGRSALTGEFRGRKTDVFLQRKRTRNSVGYLVVSMVTSAPATVDSHAMSAYCRQDRDAELALFALEAKHEVQLTHDPFCLKARWAPMGFFLFPGRFDAEQWGHVLASLHALAASLERRAA